MRKNGLNKRSGTGPKDDIKYQLAGWVLFIVCAVFFIASSLKNGDTLTFIASLTFLAACIVFIIPLVINMKRSSGDKET